MSRRLARAVRGFVSPTHWWNSLRYPGIRIATDTRLRISGVFRYGEHCAIGSRTSILVPRTGKLELGSHCYIGRDAEIGPDGAIEIGGQSSIQDRCILLGDIIVGRYCLLAPNVYISSGRHQFESDPPLLIRDQDARAARTDAVTPRGASGVVVEDDCWLGINVVVSPGTVIGKGSVVGANSVVTSNVPPYTVVAGAPARAIKKRLAFRPPKNLSSENNLDLPYFYSGFQVSEVERTENAKYSGLVTLGSAFVVALDARHGQTIHLMVEAQGGERFGLMYCDQRRQLPTGIAEVSFEIDSISRESGLFRFQPDRPDKRLILREVRVQ
ncbi:MAG: acyltransferase [Candidatus Micrarchaeaceae archaeon]